MVLGRGALVAGWMGLAGRSRRDGWHLEVIGCMVVDPGEDCGTAGVGGEDVGGGARLTGGLGLRGA